MVERNNMRDFVKEVKEFNEIAGTKEEFNVRSSALYTGLIFEELAELIASLQIEKSEDANWNWEAVQKFLEDMGTKFKSGEYDEVFDNVDRVEFLDACVDIAVVALGGGIAIGGDIEGACLEVSANNLSKFPLVDGKRVVLKDENGKIKKPADFQRVELSKYIRG